MPVKREIFKIQQSITSSGKHSKIMIYNKGRDYYGEIPTDENLMWLMHGRMKIYVLGWIDDSGKLQIEQVVKPERW